MHNLRLLPVFNKWKYDVFKAYFNMKPKSKWIIKRFRRLSLIKTFISKPEVKYYTNKINIIIYNYNRQNIYYINKLKKFISFHKNNFYNNKKSNLIHINTPRQNTKYVVNGAVSPLQWKVLKKEMNIFKYKNIINKYKSIAYKLIIYNILLTLKIKLKTPNTMALRIINNSSNLTSTSKKNNFRVWYLLKKKAINMSNIKNRLLYINKPMFTFYLNSKYSFNKRINKKIIEYCIINILYKYRKNINKKILKNVYKKNIKKILFYKYYSSMIYFSAYKYYNYNLLRLKKIIKNIYKKKLTINIVNLKHMYLDTNILAETIVKKLKDRKKRVLRVLKLSLNLIKKPQYKKYLKKYIINSHLILLDKNLNININSNIYNKNLNNKYLIFKPYNHKVRLLLYHLKHKIINGIRLQGTGRLTRRLTASRSISKMKYIGSLKNTDFSYESIFVNMSRGYIKSNLQYININNNNRNGAFGIKVSMSTF